MNGLHPNVVHRATDNNGGAVWLASTSTPHDRTLFDYANSDRQVHCSSTDLTHAVTLSHWVVCCCCFCLFVCLCVCLRPTHPHTQAQSFPSHCLFSPSTAFVPLKEDRKKTAFLSTNFFFFQSAVYPWKKTPKEGVSYSFLAWRSIHCYINIPQKTVFIFIKDSG